MAEARTEKIAWQKAANCCLTPAGLLKPTVSIDIDVTGGGTGMTVTVIPAHACGIAEYAMSVLVKGPGDTEWWTMRKININPNDNVWKWGPGEAEQLPVPSLTELMFMPPRLVPVIPGMGIAHGYCLFNK